MDLDTERYARRLRRFHELWGPLLYLGLLLLVAYLGAFLAHH